MGNFNDAIKGWTPMWAYDEQWVVNTLGPAIDAEYTRAGQTPKSDPAYNVWCARTIYRITAQNFTPDASLSQTIVELDAALGITHPLPPPPTRDQVCGVWLHFQGLTINTAQFGPVRWWDVAIDQLTPADRQTVYAAKRAAGDHHLATAISHQYAEPGVPPPIATGKDWTQDLSGYHAMLVEIIQAGLLPMVFLAGDGEGAGPGYNDPVGWTYGYDWLIANFPRIATALSDLAPYLLFVPGFDNVFYGWEPSATKLRTFGALFRQYLPNGYLAIEHNTGHIPCGGGSADWAPGGPMSDYDVVLSEWGVPLRADTFWQVAGRLLGPAYHRPADQPSGDDPSPPWYLASGSPRGPYYACSFELVNPGLYAAVRNECTDAAIETDRQYALAAGYTCTG